MATAASLDLDSLVLPARKTLSVFVLVILATSFLAAVPLGVVALSSSAGSDTGAAGNPVPLAGYRSLGAAPDDLQVLVNLAIPLRNPGLLTSMVKLVSDPASPMFHQYPSANQIESLFLPTAQFHEVMNQLQGTGLKVVDTSLNSIIIVQGSVAQVRQSLHTGINLYTNGIHSYFLSTGSPIFHGAQVLASNATALIVKPKSLSMTSVHPGGNVTFTSAAISAKLLQPVYNATGLYKQHILGQGQTIGIMDFYGSPTVAQDLKQFDSLYGFPDTNFTVVPIGPYNSNLGVSQGWDGEIGLDVQSSHAMAPKASIDLYIPNNAYSFASQIAPVVQANKVTDLSMSFGVFPEWFNSAAGPGLYYFNVFYPDELMALGSLRGISFLAASGDDGGGGGYSTSPAGQSTNPDNSPYVTSVGGTQSYVYLNPNGTETIKQTAWSNQGYVPVDGANAGGSGGGVSFTEPKPWYQASQPTPPTYPNGRMEPDLGLQGACDPATDIVIHGVVLGICGTSESSPLLAGLLTLVASYTGSHLGLINPFLYSLGNNPATYTKAFTPITNGYNIPWTAASGYNMVTGWGSPNIGEIAALMKSAQASPSLSISVTYVNSTVGAPEEFVSGQQIFVNASIKDPGTVVTTGSFSATIVSLSGTSAPTALTYDPPSHLWRGTLTMGSQSGFAYIDVSGTSGSLSGSGFAEIFAGYLGTFYLPVPTAPYDFNYGVRVLIQSTDLSGVPEAVQPTTLLVKSYSILTNTFPQVDSVALTPSLGPSAKTTLTSTYPAGPLVLTLSGDAWGFLPILDGISLQSNYIFPEVAAEPGSAAPGQTITVIAFPQAPINVAGFSSFETLGTVGSDVATGANVSASLFNPQGTMVATAYLHYVLCYQSLRICGAGSPTTLMNGQITVPSSATAGLYTIVLGARYNSITLGENMTGSYYGQIMVTSGPITPKVTFNPSILYQGESAKIQADIRYPSGQEVTQGEYTALVYPQDLQGQYNILSHDEYHLGMLTPLVYSPTLQQWVGNVTIPSGSNAGVVAPIDNGNLVYSGPYDAFVTGISWDGVPTNSAESAQSPFFVQPYVWSSGQTVSSLSQGSGLALSGDTITGSGSMSNDLFTGTNTISGGTVTITASQVSGTLNINNAKVTLVGVFGGNIVASGSSVTLLQSSVGNVSLTGSTIAISDSSYQSITPALLTLYASGVPTGPFNGSASISVTATGQNANSLTVWVDGNKVGSSSGSPVSFTAVASSLADGVHTLQATATQSDGLSSSATWYFSTNAHLVASQGQLQSTNGTLASQLSSAQKNLTTATDLLYVALAVAAVALVVAIIAVFRKPKV